MGTVSLGWLVDRVGTRVYSVIFFVSTVAFGITQSLTSYAGVYASAFAVIICFVSGLNFPPHFAERVVEPRLVGNVYGIFFVLCGVFVLAFTYGMEPLGHLFDNVDSVAFATTVIAAMCAISASCLLALVFLL